MTPLTPMHDTLARRIFCRLAIDPVSGCWNWTGSRDRAGYGQIRSGAAVIVPDIRIGKTWPSQRR